MNEQIKTWVEESKNNSAWNVKKIIDCLEKNSLESNYKVIILIETEHLGILELGSDFLAKSWRGDYSLPSVLLQDKIFNVSQVIKNLKEIHGKKVEGYKGGDFTLNELDILFVTPDFSSTGNSTAIVDIKIEDNNIYCITNKDMY